MDGIGVAVLYGMHTVILFLVPFPSSFCPISVAPVTSYPTGLAYRRCFSNPICSVISLWAPSKPITVVFLRCKFRQFPSESRQLYHSIYFGLTHCIKFGRALANQGGGFKMVQTFVWVFWVFLGVECELPSSISHRQHQLDARLGSTFVHLLQRWAEQLLGQSSNRKKWDDAATWTQLPPYSRVDGFQK